MTYKFFKTTEYFLKQAMKDEFKRLGFDIDTDFKEVKKVGNDGAYYLKSKVYLDSSGLTERRCVEFEIRVLHDPENREFKLDNIKANLGTEIKGEWRSICGNLYGEQCWPIRSKEQIISQLIEIGLWESKRLENAKLINQDIEKHRIARPAVGLKRRI